MVFVTDGNEALELMHAAHAATVSACRLSHDVMGLIRPLIRSEPCYADLRLEWIVWPELLHDLETRGGTFVVELSIPGDRGVTVIEHGRRVATFLESHPALGDPDLLDGLASGGVGSIRVLGQRGEGIQELAEQLVAASTVNQPRRDFVVVQSPAPSITDADGANATLSAFFGPPHNASDQYPELRIDGIGRQHLTPVESVLPQLKTLVRGRLQRSSGSVEEVVDGAARDRQSVGVARRPSARDVRARVSPLDVRSARRRHACVDASRTRLRRFPGHAVLPGLSGGRPASRRIVR